jgi:uncharacterized protein YbgA (DUF1722 family)/uncharacterized protein YbbK (DUF523 family)
MSVPTTHSRRPRIRIGISSCLLGARVRYDGNHKHDAFVTETLGRFFEFVPVCPEVGIGMGVPRPAIRLVGEPVAPRAVGREDQTIDVTAKLHAYGERMAHELGGLSGYIFKSKSPSCGLERVPVYGAHGPAMRQGRGLFAATFLAGQSWLPAEEEGRLCDPELRENFIERVYAFRRWQDLEEDGVTAARLVDFHASHKLALMAHDVEAYRALGRLVAKAERRVARVLAHDYLGQFMHAFSKRATPARHTNVLMHLMGYLKKQLDAVDKAELREVIERYRKGELPRVAPLTLLKHHFRRHPHPYVARQTYLEPYPGELVLRAV